MIGDFFAQPAGADTKQEAAGRQHIQAGDFLRQQDWIALDDQESPIRVPAVRQKLLEQAMTKGPPIDAERWLESRGH